MVLCPLSSVLFVNEGTAYGIFLLGRVIDLSSSLGFNAASLMPVSLAHAWK
jgi:hypothetical protein